MSLQLRSVHHSTAPRCSCYAQANSGGKLCFSDRLNQRLVLATRTFHPSPCRLGRRNVISRRGLTPGLHSHTSAQRRVHRHPHDPYPPLWDGKAVVRAEMTPLGIKDDDPSNRNRSNLPSFHKTNSPLTSPRPVHPSHPSKMMTISLVKLAVLGLSFALPARAAPAPAPSPSEYCGGYKEVQYSFDWPAYFCDQNIYTITWYGGSGSYNITSWDPEVNLVFFL